MTENGSTVRGAAATGPFEIKGKGKAAAEEPVDTAMVEDDDDDEDDEEEVEEVGLCCAPVANFWRTISIHIGIAIADFQCATHRQLVRLARIE